jgi:DNA-directed RNA polymerase specialized sigma24 family protein
VNPDGGSEALLDAARAGDHWALTALYRSLHPKLLRYLAGRLADDPEAIAAEVWLDVAARLRRFEGDECDLETFVFGIARQRLLQPREATAPAPPPFTREVERALAEVAALRRNEAEVVLLRIAGELTTPQVAEVTGDDDSEVRRLQLGAVQRLIRQRAPGRTA